MTMGPHLAGKLPLDTPLFNSLTALVKIFDRDLVMAGLARRVLVDGKWRIDKRDERGRTLDIHALRHTFGTLLSTGGVAPRTAQAAMRHSTIDLTMNVYTDPKLLDVHGALDSLPSLPLDGGPQTERIAAKATGTDDLRARPLVPVLVPDADKMERKRAHLLSTRPNGAKPELFRPCFDVMRLVRV